MPPAGASKEKARPESEQVDTWTLRIVIVGLGISGLTSFAYEIYWTRSLVFILGNSTYALSTMLSAFLTGIALGGYLVRFAIQRERNIKHWSRAWKIALIEEHNPDWDDLYASVLR